MRILNKIKLDLGVYYQHFLQRRNDRMFLNGPDVFDFYTQPPPENLFKEIASMDPALQTQQTWLVTESLRDCADVTALSTGSDLSEVRRCTILL